MSERSRTSSSGPAARRVTVEPPSFPTVPANVGLGAAAGAEWTVLCGDAEHWRVGIYSPAASSAAALAELERHTCPEAFVLLSGRVVLVLADGSGGVQELELMPGRPVLVVAPHAGYCPDGPHRGAAFVVERDVFSTEYRRPAGWAGSDPDALIG